MRQKLTRLFFTRPSLIAAQDLLGCRLVRKVGKKLLIGKIVEVEAYPGPYDRASHAFNYKKTARNAAEYLKGGYVYIYLVYGMYWQLNIATGKKGYPECVLIRALEPIKMKSVKIKMKNDNVKFKNLADGPGKLCRWLKLDKSFYGEDITTSKRIWIEMRNEHISRRAIACGPRIGIDYAGPIWARKPWRFFIKGSPFVSK